MKTEEITKSKDADKSNRCPDFDDDCKDVKNHFKCWLGCSVTINGISHDIETSTGYCPFIHTTN